MIILVSFIATYYFVAIVQTILHKLYGHKNRIDIIFQTHAKGHHGKYKPSNLLADKWIDSEQHVMWYYTIPLLPILIFLILFASPKIIIGSLCGLAFSIWWHIFLYKQYHLKNSFFEKYNWFQKKRDLHFIRHSNVTTNYAIIEYWIDSLMGTKNTINKLPSSIRQSQ